MWILTNKQFQVKHFTDYYRFEQYVFATCGNKIYGKVKEQSKWFFEGDISPRQGLNAKYYSLSRPLLLEELFIEYGDEFINKIKGRFLIMQLCPDKFSVYSDHFGIKKFFYWQDGNEFIVSDCLKELSRIVNSKPSPLGIAVYALTYHFTGGVTAFENVYHNQPGEYIDFSQGVLKVKTYWQPEELIFLPRKRVEIEEISECLKSSVQAAIKPFETISLSLTGGADTRNLLSIFLSIGIKPHLYTYGHPQSNDCVKAAAIAKGLGLEHSIHDIQMTTGLFEKNAKRIILEGNGLVSIHRAHRLMAVELERKFADQMFLGTLGGEFIKGVSEDDYIVPAIVYENWDKTFKSTQDLEKYIEAKRLIVPQEIKQDLLLYFQTEPFLKGDSISRKFFSLSHITAHLHDAQDVNIYETIMQKVYTPFLDLDYLETLFSSGFTFNNKEKIENPYLRRIQNPVYGAKFIQATYPPLLNFKYSGEHKPSEVLRSIYLAALLKGIRQKVSIKYPQNLPLGDWMADFVKENLPGCKNSSAICSVFNISRLMQDFQNEKHQTNESYWLKYTNPIMMRYIFEEYCHDQD